MKIIVAQDGTQAPRVCLLERIRSALPWEPCAIRDHAVTLRHNPICYHEFGGQLAGLISFVSRKTSPTLSLAIFIGNVP